MVEHTVVRNNVDTLCAHGVHYHWSHCLVFLSKTIYPLLSTGLTQEDNWNIVDWDINNQNKQNMVCTWCYSLLLVLSSDVHPGAQQVHIWVNFSSDLHFQKFRILWWNYKIINAYGYNQEQAVLQEAVWSTACLFTFLRYVLCGWSKEQSQWDCSFEYPQICFGWEIRKITFIAQTYLEACSGCLITKDYSWCHSESMWSLSRTVLASYVRQICLSPCFVAIWHNIC